MANGDWMFRPVFNVQKMSANLANYYFDVSSSEAMANRPEYLIPTATNYTLGYDLQYMLTRRGSILQSLDIKKFDTTITKSPIVSDKADIRVTLAIVYDFF